MAVKIRLARRGRKKQPIYDVVVADARAPRDGKFIEKLGTFNPNQNPAYVNINIESATQWVLNGAIPTETAKKILSDQGVMFRKHLQVGVNKGAITQEAADAKFDAWWSEKESKVKGTADDLAKNQAADRKARLEAEAKVNAARAEEIAKKQVVVEEVAEVEEAPAAEATEEAPVAETTEEAPAAEEEKAAE
ncbi:30S ribosomal protein S16 [Reichenbachiella agarivorans]|uniref:Small ribosomal subunit protein bS16 n=1 Tax=Reichenbachiella agarivorans TaxID=2979464 RepID=A0ABY6CUK7_9BACT|nr:30S ribosomal protein S16 [Reichenbachiella agarivorans]UXP33128.1 30S ribosomal protein S16 [Reichenbachiella agarivorans]